jgi:arabinose-5-phosphate isomerase
MVNEASRKLASATRNVVALRRTLPSESTDALVEEARRVLMEQSRAISEMATRVDESFARAVDILYSTTGHVVILGVGKSGLIGKKLASTLASTGTPAFFVHAGEAVHGDLGMVTQRDTAVLVSYSGETEEVVRLLPHLRAMGIPLIGVVGEPESTLAREVDVALDVAVDREVCPNDLAPTSSTLATLAMGDALAVALMGRRKFAAADFARFHPGGSLGRQLLTRVKDAMRSTDLPIVSPDDTVGESLMTITRGRLGLLLVMNGDRLVGLVTDGDLRRAMQHHDDLLSLRVSDIMTRNPVTIDEDTLLDSAQRRMQTMKLKALVVVNRAGKVSGVVEVFDGT